jgi:hypothetical protein
MQIGDVTQGFIRLVPGVTQVKAEQVNNAYDVVEEIAAWLPIPFRMTLQSGVPVSTSDQAAKTTLYLALTGSQGAHVSIYNGSRWAAYYVPDNTALPNLDLSGLAASTLYDIYMYALAPAFTSLRLEAVAWTSSGAGTSARNSVHAPNLVDGRWVKKSDEGRLYLGTILTDTAGGAVSDTLTRRGVWNMFNRRPRIVMTYNTNASWTYASAAVREYNNGSGQLRGHYVIGLPGDTLSSIDFSYFVTGSVTAYLYGMSNITDDTAAKRFWLYVLSSGVVFAKNHYINNAAWSSPSVGYNYITQVEGVSGGTATIEGGAGKSFSVSVQM